MALTFYVLVAFTKRQKRSNEAAMKYFLLGAFSSGILLYGMSLHLRRGRLDEPGRHLGGRHVRADHDGPDGLRDGAAAQAAAAARDDRDGRRALLQDRRRALPHVGPGRLRGSADFRHGVSFDGLQGGELRPLRAHLHGGAAGDAGRLGPASGDRRGRHHPRRQLGRRHAGELETPSRLLVHLERRLPAARPDSDEPVRLPGPRHLPARLRADEHRRVRRHHQSQAARHHRRQRGRPGGAGTESAVAWRS